MCYDYEMLQDCPDHFWMHRETQEFRYIPDIYSNFNSKAPTFHNYVAGRGRKLQHIIINIKYVQFITNLA